MKLKDIDTFYEVKKLNRLLEAYSYKVSSNCPGGFSVFIGSFDWRDPSEYLDFEMSKVNQALEEPVYDVLYIKPKHVAELALKKMDFINKVRVINKEEEIIFKLPDFEDCLRIGKLYKFCKTGYDRDAAIAFYNLEKI